MRAFDEAREEWTGDRSQQPPAGRPLSPSWVAGAAGPGPSSDVPTATQAYRLMLQRRADAQEHDSTARYTMRRTFATVVDEAVRRADAFNRLEAALQRLG